MSTIEAKAEKVANNAILTAGARIAVVCGIPITVMIGGWFLAEVTGMGRKVHGLEVQQSAMVATQTDVQRRLGALEQQNNTESGRFGQLETQIAGLQATVSAMNQNVARMLNRIDGGRP